uniref:myelin-oligodendrocyte glycoprotein-like n=1 Tax=Semicossyphus pulcher TaxID=241346 RepID=UPI0037E9BA21
MIMALIIILSISSFAVGASQVICPTQTITAVKGGEVFLTAHVDPQADLSMERVDVKRKDPDMTVHSFRHGNNHLVPQDAWYKDRTTLDSEALKRGVMNVTISSLTLNDSGPYRFFAPGHGGSCAVNLTVGDDSYTTGPPEEETTEPNNHEAALKKPLWKTVTPLVLGVAAICSIAAAAAGIYLWKPGKMKTLMSRLRPTRTHEAGPKLNDCELVNLKSKPTEEEEGQHTAEENDLRECVILDDNHPSPQG